MDRLALEQTIEKNRPTNEPNLKVEGISTFSADNTGGDGGSYEGFFTGRGQKVKYEKQTKGGDNINIVKKENPGSKQGVAELLSFIKENLDRPYVIDLTDDQRINLANIYDSSDNHLIRAKIEQILATPEPGEYPVDRKRAILAGVWFRIINDGTFENMFGYDARTAEAENWDKNNFNDWDDNKLTHIINLLYNKHPEYFDLLENRDKKYRFHEQDLADNYDLTPPSDYKEKYPERVFGDNYYSHLDGHFGIAYNPDGSVGYFFELEENKSNNKIKPQQLTLDEVLKREGLPRELFSSAGYETMLKIYNLLIETPMRHKIENEFNIKLKEFSIREQIQFINFLSTKSSEEIERVKLFTEKYRGVGIKTFLAMEHGDDKGEIILAVSESEYGGEVIGAFNELIQKGQEETAMAIEELKKLNPEITVDENKILSMMVARGKDLLVEVHKLLASGQKDKIDSLISEIAKESATQSVLREKFVAVAEMLEQEEIDLSQYNEDNILSLKGLEDPKNKALFLRALNAIGKLKPIPEIFWRVDRDLEEYSERFGVDVAGLLKKLASGDRKKIILELGPGSGKSKEERAQQGIADNYSDFALSDQAYYSLAGVLRNILDYKKIEDQVGPLSETEKDFLADYLYKVLAIEKGQTAKDNFEYDQTVMDAITDDPNNLKQFIGRLEEKLQIADEIPTDFRTAGENGEAVYPNKIKISEQTEKLQQAISLLGDLNSYLDQEKMAGDLYEAIDAHPAGLVIGDFSKLKKLKPGQVDLVLAVRSTVYEEGVEYRQYLDNIYLSLKNEGVVLDESIRENFGRDYRLDDLFNLQKRLGPEAKVYVVIGPGVKGEDYNQETVPMAFVLSKNEENAKIIESELRAGCRLEAINTVVADEKFLMSLDQTGRIKTRVESQLNIN